MRAADRYFNQLAQTRYGPMLYNRNDQYVGRSIDVYGEYGELELELLRQLCGPGSTVLDVGANIGSHTVALAHHVGEGGFVLAFEPQRVVFQTLCANVALGSLQNVECVHAALGASEGTLFVPDIDYNHPANYGSISPKLFAKGRPVRRGVLDECLLLDRADLVKIDVEGMELEVIDGGQRFLARFRPLLYVENDRIEQSEELIRGISALGYRLFWHLPPLFNPRNFRGVKANLFPGIVSTNMLCVPRERAVTIEGFDEILDPAQHPFRQ